jgi:hypothetical protein
VDAGVGNILSALLGGGLVIASNFFTEWKNRRVIQKNVASAFQAEIQGLITPFFKRRVVSYLCFAVYISESENADMWVGIEIPRPEFVVWKANAHRMGELKYPIPKLLVKFYNMYAELYEVVQRANAIERIKNNKDDKAVIYDEIILQAERFLQLGCEIDELIEEEYNLKWKTGSKEKLAKEIKERKEHYMTTEELNEESDRMMHEYPATADKAENVVDGVS